MNKYFAYLLSVVILCSVITACSKKNDEPVVNTDKKTQNDSSGVKSNKKVNDRPVSDTVYFGMWNGKQIIIDDYYKYAANEKLTNDNTGEGYEKYGGDFKALLQKLGVYDEKKSEYYFEDFKPEFANYTNLRKGDNLYISTRSGVYPAEVTGFFINLDDMIGSGTVFYAAVNAPNGAKLDENEIVVCSFNNNMKPVNRTGITNQQMLDEFKGYLIPKLKGVKVQEYDDKGNESTHSLSSLKNDDIKLFEGNFTGKGNNEYLVSVNFRNDFTNFTSAVYIMDGSGKILAELSPLAKNNFTFSKADGIIDMNGDGVWEVITEDGYYEGGGYNFHKYKNGTFETLTTGFLFGV